MDLTAALLVCRSGEFIRDDGGSMKPGWKIKFVADGSPKNAAKPLHEQSGVFLYVNPKNEDAHPIAFRDAHRASCQWRTVDPDDETKIKV